jgi:hypothetical protein
MTQSIDRQICFRLADAVPAASAPEPLHLADAHAEALSELLQAFACGEESAVLAFAHFVASPLDDAAHHALEHIANEEHMHERLLRRLRCALPAPRPDKQLHHALIRFFHGMAQADLGSHLAAVAAVDSAVCQVLAALLAPGRVLWQEPTVAAILHRIHRDEAGHVRLSRRLAAELVRADAIGAVAENVRSALVAILGRRGAAFESLGVDAARLFADLGRVPHGLFR